MEDIQYSQILLTALPLLAFVVNLSFGIFIFRRKRLLVNRLFAVLMFAFCWWNIGEFAMRLATVKSQAILILKFIEIATPCIPSIALAFVLSLENKTASKRQLALMLLGPLIFMILDIAGLLATNVSVRFYVYMIAPMNLSIYNGYVYFTAYMMTFTAYVAYRLIRFYRGCENEMVKKRIRYLLVGVFVTSVVTFITEFLVPLSILPFDLPSLGSFSTIFLTSLTYYSVTSR
jgi:hypothetical protein